MENKMKIISEIVLTAKKLGCSADQLMEEADCLAEFGQFLHPEFSGYRENQIREAAAAMSTTIRSVR